MPQAESLGHRCNLFVCGKQTTILMECLYGDIFAS